MEMRVGKILVLLTILLAVGSVCSAATAELRVGGASDNCKAFFGVYQELVLNDTGISLLVTPSSSAQSLVDLERGNIDIATTDLTLEKLVLDLEARGYPVNPESFQVQGITTNSILVYLNKGNRVAELTQQQLQEIFTGALSNWKQVGGDDLDIVVVWADQTPEQNQLFQKYVVGNRPIVRSAVWATDQKDILERVVRTPGAIGIASQAFKSPRTHSPKTPFVSATAIAITKGAPSAKIQQVLEMIKMFDN
jgi:phosphate transport system substrate-binding protein